MAIDMRHQGAEMVDPVQIPEHDEIPLPARFCNRLKFDLNDYLTRLGPQAPVKNLEEILATKKSHPSIEKRMLDAQAEPPLAENPSCQKAEENGCRLRDGVLKAMDAAKVEALVYPSWNNPPRLIGDLNTPHGNNSPLLSPPTGFPALTVPMGFVRGLLPAGLQFLGRAWSEPMLIKFAYAYEQATKHRRPPVSTPPIALTARLQQPGASTACHPVRGMVAHDYWRRIVLVSTPCRCKGEETFQHVTPSVLLRAPSSKTPSLFHTH